MFDIKGLLKNNSAFSKSNHHAWQRCNSLKDINITALLRLAKRAPILRKYQVIYEQALSRMRFASSPHICGDLSKISLTLYSCEK